MLRRLALACLVSVPLVACGGDDGSSGGTTDGGNNGDASQPDAYVPPAPNCTPLDLANASAIQIVNQQVTPDPQGGALPSGTFKLTSVKLYASGIPVTGTAKSRIELVTGNATSGAARVALNLDAMALSQPVQQDVSAAGVYTITGTALDLAEGCGGSNPLSGLTYTATPTTLTLWTSYMVTDPVTLTVPIELVYQAE
jgi:hypothetical protein